MSTKSNLSKITKDIPKEYHRKLKAIAALYGVSMRQLIVQAIEEICQCPDSSHYPNKETLKAIENIEKGKNLVKCKNTEDFFKKLEK